MRRPDENKRKKIVQAAIKLIVTEGFTATSMHRIAKEAKVAVATIYLYFENKEDMLNQVYATVKSDFSDVLLKGFDPDMPVKEGIRYIYDNTVSYFENNPLNSSFMEQFENSALIGQELRERVRLNCQPVFALIERGVTEKVLKQASILSITGFLFYPIVSKVRTAHHNETKVTKKEKEEVFQMAWDAIKA